MSGWRSLVKSKKKKNLEKMDVKRTCDRSVDVEITREHRLHMYIHIFVYMQIIVHFLWHPELFINIYIFRTKKGTMCIILYTYSVIDQGKKPLWSRRCAGRKRSRKLALRCREPLQQLFEMRRFLTESFYIAWRMI